MFCFGLQSIAPFINTNSPYFNTHSLEAGVKILLKLCGEKNKNVIHRPKSVRFGRNCALRAVLKTSGTVSPNTDLPAGE